VTEPACGAALSILYDRAAELDGFESVLVVVCGGAGASAEQLQQWSNARA